MGGGRREDDRVRGLFRVRARGVQERRGRQVPRASLRRGQRGRHDPGSCGGVGRPAQVRGHAALSGVLHGEHISGEAKRAGDTTEDRASEGAPKAFCEGPREFMLALSLPDPDFDHVRYWRSAAWCSPHTDLCSVLLSGTPRCQAWPPRVLQPGGSDGAAWYAKLRYRPCVVKK